MIATRSLVPAYLYSGYYQKRTSGPILDRIDIHIEVPGVDDEKLSNDRIAETLETIRGRVQAARNIQRGAFCEYRIIKYRCER